MSLETFPLTTLGAAAETVVQRVKPKQIIRHEPGLYFGLPEEAYFADDALGSTDLKRLLISPADFWDGSLWNPCREDAATRYKTRGTALHTHILIGEEAFHQRYARALDKDDHPDALITADDLKRALREIGGAVSGTKDVLIERLTNLSTRFKIWDLMVAEQVATGKIILPADDYDRVVRASAMIKRNPSLERCFERGMPEVSVFWEADGVRFRARFDYLRMTSIVDLKSFSNSLDKPIELAIKSAFWNGRHDMQASHYLNARHVARRFIRAGRVFGDVDMDWLNRLAEVDQYSFVFVYHTLSGATVTRGLQIHPGHMIDGAASVDIGKAIDVYKRHYDVFGEDMWVDMEPIYDMTDDDIPLWLRA